MSLNMFNIYNLNLAFSSHFFGKKMENFLQVRHIETKILS